MSKQEEGLNDKFIVSRRDGGSEAEGGKHAYCRYFVLDLDCDPGSLPAIKAYIAEFARPAGMENLCADLEARIAYWETPEGQERLRQRVEAISTGLI